MRLRRFLLPHPETHHRAHAWHPFSFLVYSLFVLTVGFISLSLPHIAPRILGYASNITQQEIVTRSNEARTSRAIAPLIVDEKLTQAAAAKALDMMQKDYWAHIAPDGTPPWKFITQAGYSYTVAGENLARNFGDPQSVVDAWLASPSHRDNLINTQYTEIGVAVVHGVMSGTETTLVVQMFGKPLAALGRENTGRKVIVQEPGSKTGGAYEEKTIVSAPVLSPLGISKRFAIMLLVFLGALLFIDYGILFRQGAARVGSKNSAHILMIAFMVMVLLAARAGKIL